MQFTEYTTMGRDNLSFIYSGLGSISDNGRKRLKNIAQSLIVMQNHPGMPIPDRICREIIMDDKFFLNQEKQNEKIC